MIESNQITAVLKGCSYPVHVIKGNEPRRQDLVKYFVEHVHKRGDIPFVMMDLGQPLKLFERWKKSLPDFKVHYAVKSNNDPLLVAVMAAHGSNFDCASSKEIEQVIDLGVDPGRIIFANPAKFSSHISFAAAQNVHLSTFCCEDELEKTASLDKHARLVLRIGVADCASDAVWSFPPTEKFGTTIEHGKELLHKAKALGVQVVGTAFHLGTGINNPQSFKAALQKSYEIFIYGKKLGFNFTILDIGGGFKGDTDSLSELNDLAEVINAFLKTSFEEFPNLRPLAEPGAFFSTSPFIVCLKVVSKVKEKSDGRDIITYTMSDGIFGMFRYYLRGDLAPPIYQVQKGGEVSSSKLMGPSLSDDDVICSNLELPEMQRDDWVWIEEMGSYSTCLVSSFSGLPRPSVYYYVHEEQLKPLVDMVKNADLKGFRLEV